ncbi:SNF1-interacting protein, partial [Mortierella sp. GBA35]
MGNTTTKEKSDHVDGGTLLPNGIYSGPQDYDFRIVQRLIHQRRLAPFYKGLEDWDDSEDALEERAAAAAYYPRNINRTRCCDKPMCTECFVQLKRLESAPTESPACPYCVEPHFGVIYSPALLPGSPIPGHMIGSPSSSFLERGMDSQNPSSPSTRRRSTSHKSPEVVAADDLRPDWNRRILAAAQRQPGSRRASTSSSVSNSTFALGRRLAVGRQGSSSRRSNSTAAAGEYNGYLAAMRNMGTDLEELMIMEAMRQSLQDEEERQAREAAATAAAAAGSGTGAAASAGTGGSSSGAGTSPSSPTGQSQGRGRSGLGRHVDMARTGGS